MENNKNIKNIKLEHLFLQNFKGIKELEIKFNDVTNISGANASGKTTIADAIRWILFDKDTAGRKSFAIKTLDENNEPIHNLEHAVVATFIISEDLVSLKKIYKEKYVKQRGATEETFTGHETLYFINDVPKKKKDYQEFIDAIVTEDVFKVITDPLYFCTLKDDERRKILLKAFGEVDYKTIIAEDESFIELAGLLSNKTPDDLRAEYKATKTKVNKLLTEIPARISECHNNIKPVELPLNEIEIKESKAKNALDELTVCSISAEVKKIIEERNRIQVSIETMESKQNNERRNNLTKLKSDVAELESQIIKSKTDLKNAEAMIKIDDGAVDNLESRINEFRKEFKTISDATFEHEPETACPNCGKEYTVGELIDQKGDALEKYNDKKTARLVSIKDESAGYKKRRDELQGKIGRELNKIEEYKKVILDVNSELEIKKDRLNIAENTKPVMPELYHQLISKHDALGDDLENAKTATAPDAELIKGLKDEIEMYADMKSELRVNENLKLRIKQLETEEKDNGELYVRAEQILMLLEELSRAVSEKLESTINPNFELVKFKLFEDQINGGLKPICEPLIGGVPFEDANNAAKYNAGLDIINALGKFFNISAPIIIDNREAVNEILETNSQIINLRVSKESLSCI